MKIKSNYVLKKIADDYVIVPVGTGQVNMNLIVNTNETGAFLWEILSKGATKEQLLSSMLNEYEVDKATAADGIDKFLLKLREADLLEQ